MLTDTVNDKSPEYEKGYDAYFFGNLSKDENPYCEETQSEKFEDWNDGWKSADSDCDDDAWGD